MKIAKIKSYVIGYDINTRKITNYPNEQEAIRNSVKYQIIEAWTVGEARDMYEEIYGQNQNEEI